MDDTAAFKFDSLPGVTFVATRSMEPKQTPNGHVLAGTINIVPHRDLQDPSLGAAGFAGPTAPPSQDKPFIPGGKVPFVFRSLPGVTFYASRAEGEVTMDEPTGTKRVAEGWIRITCYLDGDEEERELCGFAGPQP
jgi:hypothetical protein